MQNVSDTEPPHDHMKYRRIFWIAKATTFNSIINFIGYLLFYIAYRKYDFVLVSTKLFLMLINRFEQ